MSDPANPWTVARQAPLSIGFSRQDYWSGLDALLQGVFLTQGLQESLKSLVLAGEFLPLVPPGKLVSIAEGTYSEKALLHLSKP